ncbi:UvrD-helicase domain-containing protein [Ferruginibacter sp. HRS2-29]|uniref:UvrD-helicase domain-containing protein n=1 Tax=Ferruginibacter sp. HRS2-29 TaxID=2487334 RepID=UPI0020CE35E8|nr:UvrD-helicase domain-containing protein [Ferruginibacter sp. HRS2-29]MCP9750997.1 ATP-dependent helicase [Ferruginibacter sp. HRS2-29]
MNTTQEQKNIISSTADIKINAVAGSGKTTTMIEYARSRPAKSNILYIVFNKSVKTEALRKFAAQGLSNVKVETAHSLAYRHIVFNSSYKVKLTGYSTNEIAELLNLKGNGEKHAEHILANHINKFITYFCNSNASKVQELNYLEVVNDAKAKSFVAAFYPYIEKQTRLLLHKMNMAEIEIIHDFYLKKFQLANIQLKADYILFDEGQDASPAMLDIFMKQKSVKVIVGDTHQQIYGWRYAVNSLEKADFLPYQLSASFRFSQQVADLAMAILRWKENIGPYKPVTITGKGSSKEHKTTAVIARTNLGLLLKAIEHVTDQKNPGYIYFEGNINSYTYADDGASLYDVLNLYNDNRRLIKDTLIRSMKDMDDLEEYIEKTEEVQLGMMVEIVKQYGNRIPDIIKTIKARHVSNDEKDKASLIFSTVHRSKGMEYDCVHLVKDFITEEKIKKQKDEAKKDQLNVARINEEINLLYVAITRTKKSLHIPEELLPAGFEGSADIHVTPALVPEEPELPAAKKRKFPYSHNTVDKLDLVEEKAWSLAKKRTINKEANKPWTTELDEELTLMFYDNISPKEMARHFGRTTGAIQARIKKLELSF